MNFKLLFTLLLISLIIVSCKNTPVEPEPDPQLSIVNSEALPNTEGGYHAKWSPDGKSIAYTIWESGAGSGKIFVYNLESKTSNIVVENRPGDLTLCWSADSKKIIFDSYNDNNRLQLWIKDIERNTPEMLTNSGSSLQADWILNTDEIIYHHNGYIYKRNMIDGSQSKIPNTIDGLTPHCNSNKSKIVYCLYSAYNVSNSIYTINFDGSGKEKLKTPSQKIGRPRWSPNSEYIVYEKFSSSNTDLMIFEVTNNIFYELTDGGFPDWSPDGKSIVYSKNNNLWIMHLEEK